MMKDQPLVSILLLSMNHESYIEQCINSIINQTYQNIEVIYVDNASMDNTFQKGRTLLEQSGLFFKCFSNKESKTISHNLNFLFDQSSGTYISPLSTDDWFEKDNIEKKISYFSLNPDVGLVFSNGWIYYEEEKRKELNDSSSFKRGFLFKEVLTEPDCLFYVGALYKRQIIKEVGKWDESLLIEDTDMYIRIGLLYFIDFIDEPLVFYRRNNKSVSRDKSFMIEGFKQYYEKYKSASWINMNKWLAERYRSMAADCIDKKQNKKSIPFLLNAIKINPASRKNIRTLIYLVRKSL